MNRYIGTDRRNVARTGGTTEPAALAEKCYLDGWKWLRILNSEGQEVGGIKLSTDHPRRRIWWAES